MINYGGIETAALLPDEVRVRSLRRGEAKPSRPSVVPLGLDGVDRSAELQAMSIRSIAEPLGVPRRLVSGPPPLMMRVDADAFKRNLEPRRSLGFPMRTDVRPGRKDQP